MPSFAAIRRQVMGTPRIGETDHRTVKIRPARATDIDGLVMIEQQCFNVYYYAFYTLDRRDFEYYLEDTDNLFLAAILDERLVGYVVGPVERWREPPAAHIDSIAVLPETQHLGIGSRLLQSFVQQVCRHGCEMVTLEVSPANETGMAFFTKHGFRRVHRLRNYYGKGLHALLLAASCDPNRT
jgi:ribosomal-protein-alanine N-acetyltransferase